MFGIRGGFNRELPRFPLNNEARSESLSRARRTPECIRVENRIGCFLTTRRQRNGNKQKPQSTNIHVVSRGTVLVPSVGPGGHKPSVNSSANFEIYIVWNKPDFGPASVLQNS